MVGIIMAWGLQRAVPILFQKKREKMGSCELFCKAGQGCHARFVPFHTELTHVSHGFPGEPNGRGTGSGFMDKIGWGGRAKEREGERK